MNFESNENYSRKHCCGNICKVFLLIFNECFPVIKNIFWDDIFTQIKNDKLVNRSVLIYLVNGIVEIIWYQNS